MKTIKLEKFNNQDETTNIRCRDHNDRVIAIIYCDQFVKFEPVEMNSDQVDQVKTVKDHFWLFFNNL